MAVARLVELVAVHPAPVLGERIYHAVWVETQDTCQEGHGEHSKTRVDHDHVKSSLILKPPLPFSFSA